MGPRLAGSCRGADPPGKGLARSRGMRSWPPVWRIALVRNARCARLLIAADPPVGCRPKNADTTIHKELVNYLSKIKTGGAPLFFEQPWPSRQANLRDRRLPAQPGLPPAAPREAAAARSPSAAVAADPALVLPRAVRPPLTTSCMAR